MIDDQVNAEELEESKRQREAAENATDDGMPVSRESKTIDVGRMLYRIPRKLVGNAKKWLDS